MNSSNRWIIVAVVLGFFILAALIPIAFLIGRRITQPAPTEVVFFPTATFEIVLSPTGIPGSATPPPSLTPLPTNTLLPTIAFTPLPSNTPAPTNTPPPTATATPVTPTATFTPSIPCNAAQFVAHITYPDGSVVAPDADFDKIWRIKNVGSCTWTTSYTFNFISGTDMANNKNESVNLPHAVKPGETVDIKVKLNAPVDPGIYSANWLFESNTGADFGGGSKADTPFVVKIQVLNVDPNVAYDFVVQVCAAEWENSNNDELACPGAAGGDEGFVVVLPNPEMEHRTDNEPALWINPDHRDDGEVAGLYPVYNVKEGDHFRATVGCLANSQGCNVTFELSYKKGNGNVFSLGEWTETFDGEVTEIDIDLSALAGTNIQFILTVRVNNQQPENADAFWFAPRIVNEQ